MIISEKKKNMIKREADLNQPYAQKLEDKLLSLKSSAKKKLFSYEMRIMLIGIFVAVFFAILLLHYLSVAELRRIEDNKESITLEQMYKRIEGYLARDEERELDRERRR